MLHCVNKIFIAIKPKFIFLIYSKAYKSDFQLTRRRRSIMLQHQLAQLFRSQQPLMGGDRLIEWKNLINGGFNTVFRNKAQHGRKFFRRPHGGADDARLAEEQPHRVQTGRITGGCAIHRQPSRRLQHREAAFESRATRTVDHHIDAAGQFSQLLIPILGTVINAARCAHLSGLRQLGLVTAGDKDPRAQRCRPFQSEGSHSAANARH